jgi:hypothetical protein
VVERAVGVVVEGVAGVAAVREVGAGRAADVVDSAWRSVTGCVAAGC